MTEAEKKFKHQLEIFRHEAQAAAQTLYAYLTVHAVIGDNKKACDAVNEEPLFWRSCLASFHTSIFIIMGRIFERNSKHNLFALLDLAKTHPEIFSLDSLAARKKAMNPNANDWLNEFLARAHVPDDSDFRRLRRRALHYRNIFFENYKTIRNKLHAHKEISESNRINSLYGKTKIRDLENTVVYLNKLYQCLYDLFENGRKPYLPNMPYSIRSIKGKSLPPFQSPLIHQQVVTETKRVLEKLAHYDALKFK